MQYLTLAIESRGKSRCTLNPMSKLATLLAAVFVLPLALAQQEATDVAVVDFDDVEWREIVPGVEFGTLFGDWETEAHGKLVQFAPGVVSDEHIHSGGFHAVVISGTVINPHEGDEDPPRMEAGTYWSTPAGMPHATGCVSDEPCLIYAHMAGPWDFAPADE